MSISFEVISIETAATVSIILLVKQLLSYRVLTARTHEWQQAHTWAYAIHSICLLGLIAYAAATLAVKDAVHRPPETHPNYYITLSKRDDYGNNTKLTFAHPALLLFTDAEVSC